MRPNMKDLLMKTPSARTRTENGAVTNATTGSDVLNLFALGGAVRGRSVADVTNLVAAAYREDRDLALRVMFYLGDIREGQGERDFLFNSLRFLAMKDYNVAKNIIELVPEYSRWDMLYAFVGTPLESYAFGVMRKQFMADLRSENDLSLVAKWLASPGASSAETKALAKLTAKHFGMNIGDYRRARANVNRRLKTVETLMSANKWNDINFETVPAKAFMRYQKAFEKHGYVKMQKFVEKIARGEVAVKSSTLYPHEIMAKSRNARGMEVHTLESAWANLPNYIKDNRSAIAVVDTSASMTWGQGDVEPMLVAKSLGLYLSERLSGPYKDHYITFSETPQMAKFHGSTIAEKYRNMRAIVASTNLEAVYDLVLKVAVENRLPQSEIPSHFYVFSDMEFNSAVTSNNRYGSFDKTLFEKITAKFASYGYKVPVTVFWNLNARNNQSPVTQHESGAALVSGFSPVAFKYIMEGVILTPYQTMMKVLDKPRYAMLSEAFR